MSECPSTIVATVLAGGRALAPNRGLRITAALLAAMPWLGLAGQTSAHTMWGNGQPIPAWVEKSCCGPADAHHLRPDEVHRVKDGYVIDGYPRTIFDAQVLPSEDGEYWAFYSEYVAADGSRNFTSVYCFFAPASG